MKTSKNLGSNLIEFRYEHSKSSNNNIIIKRYVVIKTHCQTIIIVPTAHRYTIVK